MDRDALVIRTDRMKKSGGWLVTSSLVTSNAIGLGEISDIFSSVLNPLTGESHPLLEHNYARTVPRSRRFRMNRTRLAVKRAPRQTRARTKSSKGISESVSISA
uniref:Uncharacterized protein n=1 Tax=Pristionchus pacificus TaxID=54126 RepID=A0A2A6CFR2_PRIPA|eukprot:PDM76917.1 hypothetical protein PRIPAC_42312 [Pristionchus pacificus]